MFILKRFFRTVPEKCGRKKPDSEDTGTSASETIFTHFRNLFSRWSDDKRQRHSFRYQDGATWWGFPEPIFNTFYYGESKFAWE
jgi:hypothetical protein